MPEKKEDRRKNNFKNFGGKENRSGRKMDSKNKKTLLREQATEIAVQMMAENIVEAVGVVINILKNGDPDKQLKAAESILDRVCGKPRQAVDVAGTMDNTVTVRSITAGEKIKRLEELAKAFENDGR